MVNRLKRFFRSLGGRSSSAGPSDATTAPPTSSSYIPVLGGDDCPIGSGPYGSSSAVGFRPRAHPGKRAPRHCDLTFDAFSASQVPSSSVSLPSVTAESHWSVIQWGLVLGKIPKLVADASTASQSSASPDKRASTTASDEAANNQEDDGVHAESIAALMQLRDLLSQVVGNREFRHEVRAYYFGHSFVHYGPTSSASPPAGSEPRRVLRRCRHALIMCWKLLLSQLNNERVRRSLSFEHKELYFDIITLIAESAEFSLSNLSSSEHSSKTDNPQFRSTSSRSPTSDWGLGNNSRGVHSTMDSSALLELAMAESSTSSKSDNTQPPRSFTGKSHGGKANELGYPLSFSTNSSLTFIETAADGPDDARALFQYRCLLVATFKMVVENLDAARHRRRAWVPLAEMRFFAKVLAICYVRVPPVQAMVQQDVYDAYARKRWTNRCAHDTKLQRDVVDALNEPRAGQARELGANRSRENRATASSRLWNGVTFAGTLRRWGKFHGCVLAEDEHEGKGTEAAGASNTSNYLVSSTFSRKTIKSTKSNASASFSAKQPKANNESTLPSRQQLEAFKLRNPTLFDWASFSPYLGPCTDFDAFDLLRSQRLSLRRKLTRDGEFFAIFMGFLTWHVDATAVASDDRGADSTVVWDAISGYALLARSSMLLVKEACWAKWLYVREKSGPLPPTSTEAASPSSSRGSTDEESDGDGKSDSPFALRSIRAIRTVLDNVVQLLRNRELLDSCVLAMYESTNVLHARSVDVCLVRLEEWLMATSASPVALVATGSCEVNISAPPLRPNSQQLRVPSAFDTQTFVTGIRVMLASDNCEILNRALLFLYNRVDLFDGELRQNVLKALVQRHMALFLHWNADVRSNYHHLLVYKLARTSRDMLESSIDHLLLGKLATAASSGQEDLSPRHGRRQPDSGFDYADSHYNARGMSSTPPSGFNFAGSGGGAMSAAEFNRLRLEQALWRAFDACTAVICVNERRSAREAHRRYQHELLAARCRDVALRDLNRSTVDSASEEGDVLLSTTLSSVNESLPGASAVLQEVERLDSELHREPPYYLRYLPADELATVDELRRLASAVRYPIERQIYAAPSLRGYTDLLKTYYRELQALTAAIGPSRSASRAFVTVPAPPLGYY